MPGTSATRSATESVSAKIAAANEFPPKSSAMAPRFPGEYGGRSLAEMAHSDLDAALQLLAERAQYITGASGAAIALRRGEHNDMLCRGSTGSNAPELGALLSMEYGLSGESVRTRQALRCDDAERDARVNRETCRQLGIASVVVMPIVSEEHVLGVFELFSGKPRAFDERDLSALQRLSEMVETAVKHAVAAQTMPAAHEAVAAENAPSADVNLAEIARLDSVANASDVAVASEPPEKELPRPERVETEVGKTQAEPPPKKPLFWSAAPQTPGGAARTDDAAESIAVPPGLRNLQKCQACGFPVSQGRTFCVECEEKQWRGQRVPAPAAPAPAGGTVAGLAPAGAVRRTLENVPAAVTGSAAVPTQTSLASSSNVLEVQADPPTRVPQGMPQTVSAKNTSVPFLGSAVESESWFATNKYILGALVVVALVIGAIVLLR